MTLVLYGNGASVGTFKVRQALVLLGLEHEYRYVGPRRSEWPREFEALNPSGDVPILEVDGEVYRQSDAILLKLARDTGELGGASLERLDSWSCRDANGVGASIATLRSKQRFAPDPTLYVSASLSKRGWTDLDRLAARLSDRDFILGADVSMVDIACSAHLFFAGDTIISLSAIPAINDWLERLKAIPYFEHLPQLTDLNHASSP